MNNRSFAEKALIPGRSGEAAGIQLKDSPSFSAIPKIQNPRQFAPAFLSASHYTKISSKIPCDYGLQVRGRVKCTHKG